MSLISLCRTQINTKREVQLIAEINRDELYPCFSINTDHHYPQCEQEIPDELAARFEKIEKEYMQIQWELKQLYDSQFKRTP